MARTWTDDEKQFVLNNYQTMNVNEIAKKLKRSPSAVRNCAYEMRKSGSDVHYKKVYKHPDWDQLEDEYILENIDVLTLKELSTGLNRSVVYVQERIRSLGLKKSAPVRQKETVRKECQRATCRLVFVKPKNSSKLYCSSECANADKAIPVPPKGDLERDYYNKKLSLTEISTKYDLSYGTVLRLFIKYDLPRRNLSQSQRVNWSGKKGDQARQKAHNTKSANGTKIVSRSGYSVSGTRNDLKIYVRSRWEANVLRVLNYQGIAWEYEPTTFIFDAIKRGTRTYTPDIKVFDDTIPYRWVEVKGYLRPADKTKTKRFLKYYGEEADRYSVIVKNNKVEAYSFYDSLGIPIYAFYDDLVKEYKDKIPNWEAK